MDLVSGFTPGVRSIRRLALAAMLGGSFFHPEIAVAQRRGEPRETEVTQRMLETVLPAADSFSTKQGDPPVFEGYSVDPATGAAKLAGYAFLTSDVPPEITGYTAPIESLVGMDLEGTLTGVTIAYYRESLRSSRGDFLGRRSFEDQFAGKHITETFSVRRDIDNVSGATISVTATATGIRNAARRVATAYGLRGGTEVASTVRDDIVSIDLAELGELTWTEMVDAGLGRQVTAANGSRLIVDMGLLYLRDQEMGDLLLGPERYAEARVSAPGGIEGRHQMLIGLSGPEAFLFRGEWLRFAQDGDTIASVMDDVVLVGAFPGGTLEGEFRRIGILLVDDALDVDRPFTIVLDLPRRGVFSSDYTVNRGGPVLAAAAAPLATGAVAAVVDSASDAATPTTAETDSLVLAAASVDQTGAGIIELQPGSGADPAGPDAVVDDELPLVFSEIYEEETVLGRTLEQTSWLRVGLMLLMLALATWAFISKRDSVRLAVLATTLLYLGFFDRGFLSVSHITSGISAGPGVYLNDLPLLLIVSFTVVTTLLWGRVFCGYLCPFGALQDLMERVVPKRFKRELPDAVHRHALKLKYAILLLVLAPAVAGSQVSIFQYFEPFGTVFFWSPLVGLWAIAIAILIASAIVPRFYCRYACPLGAALAVGSLLAPFRIKRVEQCQICKVCEQKCPTGAITGPAIDFKECVRCNVCEINLNEKVGVCRHSIESIRPRLVKLTMARAGVADER